MTKIIIFGAGKRLQELDRGGVLENFEVLARWDNDIQKQGKYFNYIEIVQPNRINEFPWQEIWISTNQYYSVIKEQLIRELCVPEERIKRFVDTEIKYKKEIDFWKKIYETDKDSFNKAPFSYYKELMLAIAEEENDEFLRGKVVADFGCGPRGSLAWTDVPKTKIGIDVLAAKYFEEFGKSMASHNMIYVVSTEERIPIPDNYIDCLITMNSLDHVADLDKITAELLRILKPGGILLASFNLNDPMTECEPQTLTENILREKLLKHFMIESYRCAHQMIENRMEDYYGNFMRNNLIENVDDVPSILWFRGRRF